MEYVGPFIFNAVRFALGGLALIPFIILTSRRGTRPGGRLVFTSGLLAGTVLFLGASLQQIGIVYTTAGKAGFITGLYAVLVPILGLVVGHRTSAGTWAGIVLAMSGLYLLSFTGKFTIQKGDLIVLSCTLFWAVHVLIIGSVTARVNSLLLAMIQFFACSALSFLAAFLFERIEIQGLLKAAVPILYGGFLSVGIAYTLQVVAQRNAPPSHAAIILSLETVFAAVGGWLILSETIPARGIAGCALMLAGIILSQLGVRRRGTGAH